jgi:thioredoxin reductase (NADPH)
MYTCDSGFCSIFIGVFHLLWHNGKSYKIGGKMKKVPVVIVGSGPAGYTAAIYAARANLSPTLYEGFYSGPSGGQLMTTTEVENYPGFPDGVMGPEMMAAFRNQAARFGTTLLSEDVESVDLSEHPYKIYAKKSEIACDALIIATGASANRLDIPGANDGEFWQRGVTACAICDGAMPIFRNKDLFVIGGGDSACEEALFLTRFGSKIYIVHRRDELRASKIMQQRVMKHPKIEILWNSVITEVGGDDVVRYVILKDVKSEKLIRREAGGVFFAVGHTPSTAFLNGQIDIDAKGYIKVAPNSTRTNKPLVYACGDVQDPYFRQAVTAAGSGCMAAIEAERDLSAQGHIE